MPLPTGCYGEGGRGEGILDIWHILSELNNDNAIPDLLTGRKAQIIN